MIRYLGGKTKIAREIFEELLCHRNFNHQFYLEPFFGGGSMAKYTGLLGLSRYAFDINPSLVMMYKEIQRGWLPPETISEQDYKDAKNLPDCALKGYIGFACSYGGKWFGGFARDKTGKRNLTKESYNRILKDRDFIKDIEISCVDYSYINFGIPAKECLIYCDPPYENTTTYKTSFRHDIFWQKMRGWVGAGATVLISEFAAPPDFKCVWEKSRKIAVHNKTTNNEKIERLFIHESQAR